MLKKNPNNSFDILNIVKKIGKTREPPLKSSSYLNVIISNLISKMKVLLKFLKQFLKILQKIVFKGQDLQVK